MNTVRILEKEACTHFLAGLSTIRRVITGIIRRLEM